jgi:hypothetical protein
VVFFRSSAGVSSAGRSWFKRGVLREPYLTGFGFSREGGEDMATETVIERPELNRYRHPGCQGPFRARYRKVHDLYR